MTPIVLRPKGSLSRARSAEAWDAFVAASPQGSVFSTTPFLESLGGFYELWCWQERGAPQAGCIVWPQDGGRPFNLYQGLLLSADMVSPRGQQRAQRVIAAMLDALMRRLGRPLRLSLHPRCLDIRGVQWLGFSESPSSVNIQVRYTGVIRLDGYSSMEKEYLSQLRTTRRHEYLRARRDQLVVLTDRNVSLLDDLHRLSIERQSGSRPDHDAMLLRCIAAGAIERRFGELLICQTPAGRAISALLLLWDTHSGYVLFLGNDPAHRGSGGGTLLMLEAIRRLGERGLSAVDLCGMNSPARSEYKASLEAWAIPYFELAVIPSSAAVVGLPAPEPPIESLG